MVVYLYFPVLGSCQTACTAHCHPYYVLLPSSVSVASEVRLIIAVYSRFYNICVYICLSACALHKTEHTLPKSCHVGSLCIVLRSTILRSHPFARYGRGRQFSWRQPGQQQWLGPYAGSTAQARLRHRGKSDWQPNDFSLFLSLLLVHYSHMYLSMYII